MRFRATLELGGKTATGIRVPEQIVSDLGSGHKPAVRVTIRGHSYPSTVATMGGAFMIPVSAEIRAITGVAAGDEFDVELELDTEPRTVIVPADFTEALAGAPQARRYFDGLSYSNQRRFVVSIEGAKTAETRQRRITKAVDTLHENRPG